jgi:aminoglycoside 3-N-acetyltransferase
MTSLKDISKALKKLGLGKGDVVHLHSAMRSLGPIENGFDGFTQVFQDLLGPKGIYSVATHSWDNVCEFQPVFHQGHTPSNLGAYSNYILKRGDFLRSLHPTHSMAAWGERRDEFLKTQLNTPCPPGGNYGKLQDWEGKIVLLGVNLNRCTYFHYLEEEAGCAMIWSLWKEPKKRYIFDYQDNKTVVDYRGHENCKSENFYRIESELLKEGIMTQGYVGPAPVKVLDAKKAAHWLLPKLKEQPKFFW